MEQILKDEIKELKDEIERLETIVASETEFIQAESEKHLKESGAFYLRDNIEGWFIRRDMFAERLSFSEQVLWTLERILKKSLEV